MKKFTKQKGITLIALIITIIVMLILVGVTINVALNGGLFDKAKTASDQTQRQVSKEQLIAAMVGAYDNKGNFVAANVELPEGATWCTEEETNYESALETSTAERNWIITENGNKFYIDSNGSVLDKKPTPQVVFKTWAERGITNLTLDTYYYYGDTSLYYIFHNNPYGSWEENISGTPKEFSAEDIDIGIQINELGAYNGYGLNAAEQNKINYFRADTAVLTFDSLTSFTLYTSVSDYENGTNGLVFTIKGS